MATNELIIGAGAPEPFNRRNFLISLSGAVAAGALPLAVEAASTPTTTTTPILSLFPAWQSAYEASQVPAEQDVVDALVEREIEIADQIVALPVTDGQDFAAKFLAACAYDPMCLTEERAARLFADAAMIAAFEHYGDRLMVSV